MTLDIVVFGLSITSSWGNGHATTYRALLKALAARGHKVTFVERDVPWYREHRDLRHPGYCTVELYRSLKEVPRRFGRLVADADLVILGSYVPDGAVLGDWLTMNARSVTAFYDIDTPVTLTKLADDNAGYIQAALVPRFDLYLSFTGGPTLELLEAMYGSPRARPLYCSVDPDVHAPTSSSLKWSVGYLGTYSADRQPKLERLLIEPARRMPQEPFTVVGPQYPAEIEWPANIERRDHLAPGAHAAFYGSQRFALNVTRADMAAAGFSPSVRLFEAAACGAPVITDRWPGIETIFVPGEEILIADMPEHVVNALHDLPEERRRAIAAAARKRVLTSHTSAHRAKQLEEYYCEVLDSVSPKLRAEAVA
jgi:spore maturation protein CgeB